MIRRNQRFEHSCPALDGMTIDETQPAFMECRCEWGRYYNEQVVAIQSWMRKGHLLAMQEIANHAREALQGKFRF